MSWSIRIARLFGIPIRVHVTFLLIVGWGAWAWGSAHGLTGALFGVGLTLLLFASVALHELGHSVVAQRRGLEVLEIALLPIGGVATLNGRPARPRDELQIALAGPAVNLAIAVLLGAAAFALHGLGLLELEPIRSVTPSWSTLLALLLAGNLTLALFNMLPIFPMDGGRVLRALLASRWGMERGTRWAAGAGQVGAVAMGAYAVVSGAWLLALVAALVFLAAGRERFDAAARGTLASSRAAEVAQAPGVLLEPGESIVRALSRSLRSSDDVFPVVLGEQLVGVVSRAELAFAARAGRSAEPVAAIQSRGWVDVDVDETLDRVLEAMERERASLAVVHEDGVPVGVISRGHLYSAVLTVMPALGGTRTGMGERPSEAR